MDDALSAERLRALAFASIPETSQRSHCWVRVEKKDDKEEGELSSDGEIELRGGDFRDSKRKVGDGKKKKKKKKRRALQSSASPTGIQELRTQTTPEQSLVYRLPAATTGLTKQGNITSPELQKQTTTSVAQATGSSALPKQLTNSGVQVTATASKTHSVAKDVLAMGTKTSVQLSNGKATIHRSTSSLENPFLIKFSDDDSDGEIDATVKTIPAPAIPILKPASLSVEIDRMKKQIAAIERVKGKSLPTGKSIKHVPVRQSHSGAAPKETNSATQTHVDTLKKQIASKLTEMQQQKRKEIPSSVPDSGERATNMANPPDISLPAAGNASQQNQGPSELPSGTKRLPLGDSRQEAEKVGLKRATTVSGLEEEVSVKRQKVTTALENSLTMKDDRPKGLPQRTDMPAKELATRSAAAEASISASLEELELEEHMIDKELEEAQHHRHMCEIRERLAWKAYREAQQALKTAAANCDQLYRRRDIVSLRVKAAEFGCQIVEESLTQRFASAETRLIEDAKMDEATASPAEGMLLVLNQPDVSADISPPAEVSARLQKPEETVSGRSASEGEVKEHETGSQPIVYPGPENAATDSIDMITLESGGFCRSAVIDEVPQVQVLELPGNERANEPVGASVGEDEELQGSSSAGELKDKMEHVAAGNELETFGRNPEPDNSLNPHEDNGFVGGAKQGSSTASSVDTVTEDLERIEPSTQTAQNISSEAALPHGTKVFARLLAGRLVVFRQLTSNLAVSEFQVQEVKNTQSVEPCGEYESSLQKSALSELDPFQPLCKYEHRGKCNNEVCSFQHVKQPSGYSQDTPPSSEKRSGSKLQSSWTKFTGPAPTYHIAAYLMKDCQDMTRTKCFNVSAVAPVSSLYAFLTTISTQRPLPQDMPCISDEGSKGYREDADNFEVANGKNTLCCESSAEGCLDLALNILKYGIKLKSSNCLKNALCILSRALEDNQSSIPVWVVYLFLISMEDSVSKKDDIFLHAVRLNKYSYDLWSLFLANKSNLPDLLESFDAAIVSLCEGNQLLKDGQYSACILDLVLKMFYTLVMSENDVKKWIDNLLANEGSNGMKSSSVVWKNLQESEASILWVCCAYYSAYGSLPEAVISRLGCKQDLPLSIEWERPEVVSEEVRLRVTQVLKTGSSCLSSSRPDDDLPMQALAVNYIKFLVAFDDLEYASTYGQQMLQLHPSSVELTLLCAEVQRLRGGCRSGLSIFQKALSNWPSKRPGIQVLWNQYAGYALEREGEESALVILQNCSTKESRNGLANGFSTNSEMAEDFTFSLVNLALLEFLTGKRHEAQVNLDKALSSAQVSSHCWLEFAAFKLSGASGPDFLDAFTSILDRCHVQSRLSPKLPLLGRSFLKNVKKRHRSFIDTLLGPAPVDFSFVNSLLGMFFGPGLLPTGQRKLCMRLGGGLLDLFPSNSVLAMAFCKALSAMEGFTPSTAAWAASLLVTSLRQSFSPEALWLEAGDWLQQHGLGDCSGDFYTDALSAHPFSASLWRRYISQSGNREAAVEAAKGAGLAL